MNDVLEQALELHRAGRLADAEQLYRQILAADPACAAAWHLLGVIAHQAGQGSAAIELIGRAISLDASRAEFHSNLGEAYRAAGLLGEAAASCRRALALDPEYPQAWLNLGTALERLGQLDEAEVCLHRAAALDPQAAEAYYNLGKVAERLGRAREAEDAYRRALVIRPDFAAALNNLGNVYREQGRAELALACYRQAVACDPNLAEAYANLGQSLKQPGTVDEAVAMYREALRLRPEFTAAWSGLGVALALRGELKESLAAFRRVLQIDPRHREAHSNLLYALNFDPNMTAAELFTAHRQFGETFGPPPPRPPRRPGTARRLQIGYVSPDFREHAAAWFMEPFLAHHDPAIVEITLYSDVPMPDAVSRRFEGYAAGWRNIWRKSDSKVADLVRSDQIDVLVDLAGHSARNRLGLFALRPAPVQATYLGYPNTTGLATIDFRLTDAVADPPSEAICHTEQLVRLVPSFFCYAPPRGAPEVAPSPALETGRVTFGSLHNLVKLNAPMLDLWCDVLAAVPTSRLLIFRDFLQGVACQRLERYFTERGLGSDRVELRHQLPADGQHLSVYADVDISLDALPWNGHTTACESLWMGVPLVTLRGQRHAGRLAASVLTTLGLQQWIAETRNEYVTIAASLADDLNALAKWRATLRERMAGSALCDGLAFTRRLEAAYMEMMSVGTSPAAKFLTPDS